MGNAGGVLTADRKPLILWIMAAFDNLDWSNWFYGLLAGMIGGGSSAFTSGISASAIDPTTFAFGSSKSVKLMVAMFVWNAVLAAFLYLKQNPLPKVKTVTTVETTERISPKVAVVTTVEQTKVTEDDPKP